MGHLGPEELRRVQCGLVDHHGHALGLHALHDALDGARAEVVGVGLHRQAVHAHDRLLLAGVHAVPHHLQHLVGHEVLAGAVGVHDGLDQVLRHVPVVGQQLLGVLGQAVAAVAEAGVVVVRSDARLQAHAVDDVAGVEAADLAVGVELVEVGHAQRKVGIGEELHCLGLGGAQHQLRDALGAVVYTHVNMDSKRKAAEVLVKAVVVAQSEPKQATARRQGPKTQRARAANRIAARALSRSPPLGGRRMHPSLGHRPQGFAPQLPRRGGCWTPAAWRTCRSASST